MIDSSMLPDFIVEATEHLDEMETNLLGLEKDPANRELLDSVFRAMHTIKGAGQFVGAEKTATLAHRVENVLDLIRQGERHLDAQLFDVLIRCRDRIVKLVAELDRGREEFSSIADLLAQLETAATGGPAAATAEEPGLLPADGLDEEGDSELFGIFMEQLNENLSRIHQAMDRLQRTANKFDPLERIAAALINLQSSANYMGYEKLSDFYEKWHGEAQQLKNAVLAGQDVNVGSMGRRLDRILATFPQVKIRVIEEPEEEGPVAAISSMPPVEPVAAMSHESPASLFDDNDLFASLATALNDKLGHDNDSPTALSSEAPAAATAPAALRDELPAVPALSTPPQQRPEKQGSPRKLGFLDNKVYDEDHDEELFDIFIKQLGEKIASIRERSAGFSVSGDKLSLLGGIVADIEMLKAAANYMGYSSLTSLYNVWGGRIRAALDELRAGEEPGLDFMTDYIEHIVSAFPQIAEVKAEVIQARSEDAAREALSGSPPFPAAIAAVKEPAPLVAAEQAAPGLDGVLFDRLSAALEVGFDQPRQKRKAKPSVSVIEAILLNDLGDDAESPPVVAESPAKQAPQEKAALPANSPTPAAERPAPGPVAPPGLPARSKAGEKNAAPTLVNQEPPVPLPEPGPGEALPARHGEEAREARSVVKQTMRVDANKIDDLMNQVGELVVSRSYFSRLVYEINGLQRSLTEMTGLGKAEMKPLREFAFKLGEASVALGRVSNELQEGVMRVRMLAIANLFNRYPRLVRDLVQGSGKEVRLEIRGEDTELDKMVIEEISDPLIHIIRNAVDHGIETREERRGQGKPEDATLVLEAFHESNHIIIDVVDDGRGIDPARLKAKALADRLFSREELELMSDEELTRLMFRPGFSTAKKATATSGRGVGMDVVKKNVEKLNGSLELDSVPGKGTRVRIKIPLTLAIIQALIVRVLGQSFAIPLSAVDETLRVLGHEFSTIEGVEVLNLRDATLPIFQLSALFGDRSRRCVEKFYVVVVHADRQRIGLVVDALVGQEEVVIKPLAEYLREKGGFSGATIMGDGSISLIIDVPGVMRIATEKQVVLHREMDFPGRTDTPAETRAPASP